MENYQFTVKEKVHQNELFYPNEKAIGDKDITNRVSVFTEWGQVKCLILGYFGDTSNLPLNDEIIFKDESDVIAGKEIPTNVIKRCQNIQNNCAFELMKRGIKVYRVGDIDMKKEFLIENVSVSGFNTFSSRDLIFFYDNMAIEFPSFCISRQNEHCCFNWITEKLRENGSELYLSYKCLYSEKAPLIDAAQLLRIGLDIIVLVSMGGTYEGYLKVKEMFDRKYSGLVRVHPLLKLYEGIHIDTTITLLGFNKKLDKYLVLVNPDRVNPLNMPAIFRGKNWIVLDCAEFVDQGYSEGICIASTAIGMNIFVINSELVIIDDAQKHIADQLNFYGIETIQVKHEMGRTVSGGMHCMTNEFVREEEIDFEKLLKTPKDRLSKEEKACYFDIELLEFLESKSEKLDDWEEICNNNGIFATYAVDHLDEEGKIKLHEKNKKYIYI